MPAVRVIRAYETRGVYALTAAVGLITGCIAAPLLMTRPFAPPGPSVAYDIACVFIPPAMFMLIFAMRCQRKRPVFLTGFLFTFCYWLTVITAMDLLSEQSGGAQLLSGIWVAFLVVSSAAGLIAGLAALSLRWILRTFAFRLIEQTGRLCPRCAYAIDPATQPVCPECGSAMSGVNLGRTSARPAREVGRPLLIVVLLGFLATSAVIITHRGYPIYRFQAALDAFGERPAGSIYDAQQIPRTNSTSVRAVAGAWIPFPPSLLGDDYFGVLASYLPEDEPGLPAMQLILAVRAPARTYTETNPRVICSLDRDQAEFVITNGIPIELLAAFQTTPSYKRDYIIIDPAPYFPK